MAPELATFIRDLEKTPPLCWGLLSFAYRAVGWPGSPDGFTACCNFGGRALKASEESQQAALGSSMAVGGEALQKRLESEASSQFLFNTCFA